MIGRILQFFAAPFCRARGLHAAVDWPGETLVVRDPRSLRLDGWAFVTGEPLSRVRVFHNGDPIGYAHLDAFRPDVVDLRPGLGAPEQCGFAETYRLARPIPPGVNKIRLEADLRDGTVAREDFYFWAQVVPDYKAEYERTTAVACRSFLASGARLSFELPDDPQVSVIIPAYKREQLTLAALQSLRLRTTVPTEVIVIDNSPDDATERLAQRLDGVRYVRNSENEGFGPAVNRAAALARGRVLVIMNNDCALVNDAVGAALARLDSDRDIGAVGGRIHLLDGTLQEAGSRLGDQAATEGTGRGLPVETNRHMHVRDIDYASAVFLAVDAALYRELGGFDDDYAPAYFEDTDLCTRIWKSGRRVVYDPSVVVLHMENASTTHEERWSLYAKNREAFRTKHPELDRVAFDPARYECRSSAIYRPQEPHIRAMVVASKLACLADCEAGRRLRNVVGILGRAGCRVTIVAPDGSKDGFAERSFFETSTEVVTGIVPTSLATLLQGRGSREGLVVYTDGPAEETLGPVVAANADVRATVRLDDASSQDDERKLIQAVDSVRRSI